MKSVIYTTAFGQGDLVPRYFDKPGDNLVVFTDNVNLHAAIKDMGLSWQVEVVRPISSNPAVSAAYYIMLPHLHFPNVNLSTYIAPGFRLQGDVQGLITTMHMSSGYSIFRGRDLSSTDIPRSPALDRIRYLHYDFPEDAFLPDLRFISRRHNDASIKAFNESWFSESNKFRSYALSWSYVYYDKGLSDFFIAPGSLDTYIYKRRRY